MASWRKSYSSLNMWNRSGNEIVQGRRSCYDQLQMTSFSVQVTNFVILHDMDGRLFPAWKSVTVISCGATEFLGQQQSCVLLWHQALISLQGSIPAFRGIGALCGNRPQIGALVPAHPTARTKQGGTGRAIPALGTSCSPTCPQRAGQTLGEQ